MPDIECPFCHSKPRVSGKMAWCANPRCWIKGKKIPRKVWESLESDIEVSQVSLGTCITCRNKDCFGRINTGDGFVPVDFCSLHDVDLDLELTNPLNELLPKGWESLTLRREAIDKMPIGWVFVLERLLVYMGEGGAFIPQNDLD